MGGEIIKSNLNSFGLGMFLNHWLLKNSEDIFVKLFWYNIKGVPE